MKLLLLQDFLRSGGTERQSVLLANAFAAAGHATTLLTFRPGGALAPTVAAGVRRVVLQPFDTGLDWFAPGLRRRVRAIAPDLIVCMGRMANCHGWRLTDLAPVLATMRTGKPLPSWFRRTLREAIHIVANSHDARRTLIEGQGLAGERITVIHNSLVFPAVAPAATTQTIRAATRTRFGADPDTAVLLCVAMFRPEKNQRELIEIAAGLPTEVDWQLWLAGEGPARTACEALVRARGLAGRVRFPGFQRDPSTLYAAADVAVHASWSEALSNFLIEAQAHGLPAVAYQAQGIEECFVPGRTGWAIPRDDRAAFRSSLLSLLRLEPADRASRAAAARDYARRTFAPDRQVAAYLELFHRLHRPPAP
jgi:glycosyltransferase involved in cell wall biosynthesis